MEMSIYYHIGNALHLTALVLLFVKIIYDRSCTGISGKSQILYGLVFGTRYLDVFIYLYDIRNFSAYNVSFKIAFQLLTYGTILLIFYFYKMSYEKEQDSFRYEFLLLPPTLLTPLILFYHSFDTLELFYNFSVYLEVVAMLPQFWMTIKQGRPMKSTVAIYLLLLGSYRALFICHWVYKYVNFGTYDMISNVSGTIQTLSYVVFAVIFLIFAGRNTNLKQNYRQNNIAIVGSLPDYQKISVPSFLPAEKNEKVPIDNANMNDQLSSDLTHLLVKY